MSGVEQFGIPDDFTERSLAFCEARVVGPSLPLVPGVDPQRWCGNVGEIVWSDDGRPYVLCEEHRSVVGGDQEVQR